MNKSTKKPSVIIVGAGTSGSVICSKLESEYEVLVFEKSDNKNIPLINRIPLLIGMLYKSNNNYIRKIEFEYDNARTIPFFESNSLNGASAMNGCVHVLGIYSKWLRFLKKYNLELKDMEKSYCEIFTNKGENKKISLRKASQSNLDIAFQEALRNLGVKTGSTDIMNDQACGAITNTTKKIFRSSVADLKPFRRAKVNMSYKVTNLLLGNDNKVVGVVAGGRDYMADHVILTAGVIGTNQLLLCPALRVINKEKIKLDLDVGKGIKDHVNLRINVKSNIKIQSLNIINKNIIKKFLIFIKHILGFDTLLLGTGATSSANLDLDGDGVVDTRINLLNFSENGRMGSDGKYFDESICGYSLSISTINPISEGTLDLSPCDIKTSRIRPNYLNNIEDFASINKAIDFAISILKTDPLLKYVLSINEEDKILKDRKTYIKENLYSGYHLIGGCHKIVDENFQVNKLGNLYICDASIFSEYLSSNIHAPVVIVADLFSEKFLNRRSS
jgi:choline dehydrogenase-like flavoprotein